MNKFNRNLKCLKPSNSKEDLYHEFHNSDWFKKYMLQNYHRGSLKEASKIDKATIYCGNALDVLHVLKNDSISAIVTSPHYYNAKEYSNWPNIYYFLYDIYNIALELFRTLKDGSSMLFNIFDYFDNERIIAQSAMGNKRMILGAYMLDIFEKIGFRIDGNIIWDKGEIQGNRNFNQGNLGPYYQSPLNCWEHIFILSKNKTSNTIKLHSNIIQLHPVVKMVKEKNILGHTAPYPSKIPSMIIEYLNKNDTVLDPFLGSGTTCVVANSFGVNSIGIELNENYYTLCKNIIKESTNEQLNLFNF